MFYLNCNFKLFLSSLGPLSVTPESETPNSQSRLVAEHSQHGREVLHVHLLQCPGWRSLSCNHNQLYFAPEADQGESASSPPGVYSQAPRSLPAGLTANER
jgi:hypothetical protein